MMSVYIKKENDRKNMSLIYIGSFPPEYGGVTVKNDNLYTAIRQRAEIRKIDLSLIKKGDMKETFRLISSLVKRKDSFVIGVSGGKTKKRFCHLMYLVNRRSMQASILIVMGGTASKDIAKDKAYQKYVKNFKTVYVETKGMRKELLEAGVENVDIYPNCRFKPVKFRAKERRGGGLRCVFFSNIHKEKGVDIILETARMCPQISFAFYGGIAPGYKDEFMDCIARRCNVVYKGEFTGTNEERYVELSNYDILLLPTRWKSEGVPGIIVEARIAGLVPIVTDHNYNKELVADESDGILLKYKKSPKELSKKIIRLCTDETLYLRLRDNSMERAEEYYIENYIDKMMDGLITSAQNKNQL